MVREVFHTTDLFKPFNDPDDHFDVAVQYCLMHISKSNLTHIIIDKPPLDKYKADEHALEELNYIFKRKINYFCINDIDEFILYLKFELLKVKKKIDIHICGSCEFIAKFAKKYPLLIKKKIHRIYLNAGSGVDSHNLEYNSELDKDAYSSIFDLPCQIYWLPCFHDADRLFAVGKYGSFFHFKQKEVLKDCSNELKNYFVNALEVIENENIENLNKEIDIPTLNKIYEENRNIYCLAGILSSANLKVSLDGEIINTCSKRKVLYEFVPIKILSNQSGRIVWKRSYNRFSRVHIFWVRNINKYKEAMTKALCSILSKSK